MLEAQNAGAMLDIRVKLWARQYASTLDREEMQKAVYFAHMHRGLYLTVNTLVDEVI
ncbi:MAG: hypothetical protein ACLR2G_05390 [Phascolarctobacterium faecium]